MDELTLYFMMMGGLGLVAFILLALAFTVGGGQSRKKKKKGYRPEIERQGRAPRVQIYWAGEGMPLTWIIDGRTYVHPDSVTQPEQRALLEQFLEELREIEALSGPSPASQPTPARAAPLTTPTPASDSTSPATTAPVSSPPDDAPPAAAGPATPEVPVAAPPPPAAPLVPPDEEGEEAATPVPASPDAPPAGTPSKRTYEEEMERPLFERLRSSFLGTPPKPSPAEIIDRLPQPAMPKLENLDEILQSRLVLLPNAPPASIRTGSNGLLEIVVAGRIYERIDDVPHEEVRQAMREAVRIWEKGIG